MRLLLEFVREFFLEILATLAGIVAVTLFAQVRGRLTAGRKPSNNNLDFNLARLKNKLDTLHYSARPNDNCPFVMVGSVYLDIILRHIKTKKLGRDEWSNIPEIEFRLGGSGLFVGRFLYSNHNKKSYLLSLTGGGDDLATCTFGSLIEKESWLLNKLQRDSSDSRTAITVHLVQYGDEFTTMFTNTGTLVKLDWSYIQEELGSTLNSGGVLYISGYMKTNLCNGLEPNLHKLCKTTLICIDHGRIIRGEDDPRRIQFLKAAFAKRLVDIYICTYEELWSFCHFDEKGKRPSQSKNVKATLEKLATDHSLPLITIVRGRDLPGETKAYTIVGRTAYPLEGELGPTIDRSSVGAKNAFNAALIYELIYGPRFGNLKDQVIDAGQKALKIWHECQD